MPNQKIEMHGSFILAPVPVVIVGCAHKEMGKNLITIAWTGVDSADPETIHISIRPSRYSYKMIKESRCFTVNIPTVEILPAVDKCGIISGNKCDKFDITGLTAVQGTKVDAPMIKECPINLECELKNVIDLGLHHMFIGEVVAKHALRSCMTNGKVDAAKIALIAYIHGEYWSLGKRLERSGFSL